MKVASWNVNSIRARLPRLVAWLTEQQPDVVCLQEIKVEESGFPHIDVRALGYEAAVFGQRTYNGVAILSRVPLTDVVRGLGDGEADDQARFISARVGDIRVASVYVPNGQAVGSDKFRYKLAWLRRLRAHLARDHAVDQPLVLCGDYNVAPEDRDVHDPVLWKDQIHCHPDERAALADLCAWGVEDLFRRHHEGPGFYSWWDYRQLAFPKNKGLRIDHLLATPGLAARCGAIHIDRNARKGKDPSDHAPVVATFS